MGGSVHGSIGTGFGLALWDSQTTVQRAGTGKPAESYTMNAYKIKYANGEYKIIIAKNSLEVVKKYDLATRENINTRIYQLEGEQKAIAFSNLE